MEQSALLLAFQKFVQSSNEVSKLLELLPACEIQFQIQSNSEKHEITNFNVSCVNHKRKREEDEKKEEKKEEVKKQKLIQTPLPKPPIFHKTLTLTDTKGLSNQPKTAFIKIVDVTQMKNINLASPILPHTKIAIYCCFLEKVKIVYYLDFGYGSTKMQTKYVTGQHNRHYDIGLDCLNLAHYDVLKITMLVTPFPSDKNGPVYGIEEFNLLSQ